MKFRIFTILGILALAFCLFLPSNKRQPSFLLTPIVDQPIQQDKNEENQTEELKVRQHEEFLKTLDPALGYVPSDRLLAGEVRARQIMESLYPSGVNSVGLAWTERGPNNIGGRTRTLVVDKTDITGNTVIAGSVGGGIWRSTNFLNATPTWTRITSVSQNLAITCIAQSPNSTTLNDTLYAGTGEGYNNSDAIRGLGMYKSYDGGLTWSLLASTTTGGSNITDFSFIQKILVTPNGNIYAAASSAIFCNAGGVLRSQDKGVTWTRVIGIYDNSGFCSGATDFVGFDLEISASGDLWAATQTAATGTGRVWRSPAGATVGNVGTWVNVTPPPVGAQWRRIELAASPLTNNRVYAIMQGASVNSIGGMRRTDDAGATWTNITNTINWCDQGSSTSLDFSRNQAWYDLTLAVKPDDDNTVYAGGVDLMKTTDAGATWVQATQWNAGCGALPQIHADNHSVVFMPGFPSQFIAANDGGMYYTADNGSTFTNKNNTYNVTQYYGVAMNGTSGSQYMLAGAQDNGSQKLTTAGIGTGTTVSGGDGGLPFIDPSNGNNQITNFTGTNINISTNGSSFFNQGFFSTDRFINPADLDNSTGIYYCGGANQNIRRLTNTAGGAGSGVFATAAVSSGSTSNSFGIAPVGYSISAIKVDPNTANRVLAAFATSSSGGVGSQIPLLYRVDAANATPVGTAITLPALATGTYISSIDVEIGNASHLLITLSNYGITSVYESPDLGVTWNALDNNGVNLPDVPVRWGMFIPGGFNPGQSVLSIGGILLGTELGVWSAGTLSGTTTNWTQNSNGFGNLRVDMIRIRSADKAIAIATHGRGVFTSTLINNPVPLDFLSFKGVPLTNSNQLTWDVTNEYRDAGFDVERKYSNENSFTTVGRVAATNSSTRNSYSYEDRNIELSQPLAYYRLKQNDLDGHFKYSSQILIKRANAGKLIYYVSADRNQLMIRAGNKSGVNIMSVQIYDLNGKLIISQQKQYADQYINISGLASGSYVVKCSSAQSADSFVGKFVK